MATDVLRSCFPCGGLTTPKRPAGQDMIEVAQSGESVMFAVRVQPRTSRDEIVGEWPGAAGAPGALKVRLTAPPLDDRANAALCRLLAEALGVAVSAVRIASGERSRMKRVEVRGVTVEQVRALIKNVKA